MRWNHVMLGIVGLSALAVAVSPQVPVWVLLAAVGLHWLPWLWERIGFAGAIALEVILTLWLVLAIELVAQPLHLPIFSTCVVVAVALGVCAFLSARRARTPLPAVKITRILVDAPVFAGVAVWFLTLIVARFLPGSSHLSWVMRNDAANNMLMARDILADGGIALGAGANPVPLTAGCLGLFMDTPVADGMSPLHHDLLALLTVWVILVAALAVLVPLLVRTILVRLNTGVRARIVLVTVAALLPLTWGFSGYPIEFGFLNAQFALVALSALLILFYRSDERPRVVVVALFLSVTVLLAVWSPVTLVPLALGLVVVVRQWRVLLATRGWVLGVLLASVVQLIVFVCIATIPSYLSQSSALSAPGGAFAFPWQVFAALALLAVTGAIFATRSLRTLDTWGVVAVALSSACGLAFLLFMNRNLPSLWTYYPLKFVWLVSVLVFVLAFAYWLGGFAARPQIGFWVTLGLVGVFVATSPIPVPLGIGTTPVYRILAGTAYGAGDQISDDVLNTRAGGDLEFFWKSGNPNESQINFWVLSDYANTLRPSGQFFREYAYRIYDAKDDTTVCKLAKAAGGKLTVHTADPTIPGSLAEKCPDMSITVVPG
jgi:hypothetical protein